MATATLTKQFILDAFWAPIAVILPIEDYEALVMAQSHPVPSKTQDAHSPLFSALQHLSGKVASTEEFDATIKELWSTWDQVPEMPDRVIAATALQLGIPLISRDAKIKSSRVQTIW